MTQGSTPVGVRRHRGDDDPTETTCTRLPSGLHPVVNRVVVCPACYPTVYSRAHARHRSDWQPQVTMPQTVTR